MAKTKPSTNPDEIEIPDGMTEAEAVQMEFQKMQVMRMRREMRDDEQRIEKLREEAYKRAADAKRTEWERARRQAVCKHRKGGRNNQFANGTAAEYSIVQNTYPWGEKVIMCTRCGKETAQPELALRKANPELYAAMLKEWKEWASWPTDNSPSGGKIFEVTKEAA